jgi:hypothetical protein
VDVFVYTCIVCRRDVLPPVGAAPPGFTFTCFTDEPAQQDSGGWRVVDLVKRCPSPVLTARWHKILPHLHSPGHDYYVWVDGNISLKVDLRPLLPLRGAADIAVFPHRHRSDPYEEAQEVARRGLEHPRACALAEKLLIRDEYPMRGGLHETGILIMRNTSRLRTMLNEWWSVLEQVGGSRDQLHFDRLIRKHSLSVLEPPGNVITNEFFNWTEHLHVSQETRSRQELWTT